MHVSLHSPLARWKLLNILFLNGTPCQLHIKIYTQIRALCPFQSDTYPFDRDRGLVIGQVAMFKKAAHPFVSRKSKMLTFEI